MDQENFVSKNGANPLVYPGKFIIILTFIAFKNSWEKQKAYVVGF